MQLSNNIIDAQSAIESKYFKIFQYTGKPFEYGIHYGLQSYFPYNKLTTPILRSFHIHHLERA